MTTKHILVVDNEPNKLESYNGAVVRGNLRSMSLPSIVQINCTERNRAHMRLRHHGQEASIFFADGEVVHAASGSLVGEEAIYELLTWDDAEFELEMGVPPPDRTVTAGWSGLLMEGIRRIDECSVDHASNKADSADEDSDEQPPPTIASEVSEQIKHLLNELLDEVNGRCVLMAHRSGRLMYWQGGIDKSQAISLAALVAGSFSATAAIAGVLRNEGETRQFTQSLQESEDFSIYSVAVGEGLILSISFDNDLPLGFARVHTSKVTSEIQQILAEDTVEQTDSLLDEGLRQEVRDALDAMLGD